MLETIYNFLLSLTNLPLAIMLLCGALYFMIRTKFVQGRLLKESIRVVMEKPKNQERISSFGALMISTASSVVTHIGFSSRTLMPLFSA